MLTAGAARARDPNSVSNLSLPHDLSDLVFPDAVASIMGHLDTDLRSSSTKTHRDAMRGKATELVVQANKCFAATRQQPDQAQLYLQGVGCLQSAREEGQKCFKASDSGAESPTARWHASLRQALEHQLSALFSMQDRKVRTLGPGGEALHDHVLLVCVRELMMEWHTVQPQCPITRQLLRLLDAVSAPIAQAVRNHIGQPALKTETQSHDLCSSGELVAMQLLTFESCIQWRFASKRPGATPERPMNETQLVVGDVLTNVVDVNQYG